jgi:hypothetical protein
VSLAPPAGLARQAILEIGIAFAFPDSCAIAIDGDGAADDQVYFLHLFGMNSTAAAKSAFDRAGLFDVLSQL